MQTLQIYRARFGTDIVAEFLPPHKDSSRVVIITSGAPGYPGGKRELMELLSKKGYWSIVPRYRGTWESDGVFLEYPPSDDVFILMDQVPSGFRELWSSGDYRVHNPEFYLIGGSFGGPAALIASADPRVKRVAVISSVVDWREQEHTAEPLDLMSAYVPSAFGGAYRSDPSVWKKLAEGNFYNPVREKESLQGEKILFIHAKDDPIVHYGPAEALAKDIGAKFVLLPNGGHMGASSANEPRVWKHIEKFFNGR